MSGERREVEYLPREHFDEACAILWNASRRLARRMDVHQTESLVVLLRAAAQSLVETAPEAAPDLWAAILGLGQLSPSSTQADCDAADDRCGEAFNAWVNEANARIALNLRKPEGTA